MSDDIPFVFTPAELKKHDAAVRLELLTTMKAFTGHVVEIQPTEFAIQHPWACRPDLLNCHLNQALNALDGPPAEPGFYKAELVDGEVVIGDPVAPGTDPLLVYLLTAYPED